MASGAPWPSVAEGVLIVVPPTPLSREGVERAECGGEEGAASVPRGGGSSEKEEEGVVFFLVSSVGCQRETTS